MPQKNEIKTLTAVGYTSEGEAVCREDGFVVFVPGMLKGERAEVQLLKVKKPMLTENSFAFWNNQKNGLRLIVPHIPGAEAVNYGICPTERNFNLKNSL